LIVAVATHTVVAELQDPSAIVVITVTAQGGRILLDFAELVSDVVEEGGGESGLGLRQRVAIWVVGVRDVVSADKVVNGIEPVDGVVGVGEVLGEDGPLELDGLFRESIAD